MFECEKQNKAIAAAVKYGMSLYGITPTQMALSMRCCPMTVYNRLNHPEDFTIGELRSISAKIHIPLEKLVKGEIQ